MFNLKNFKYLLQKKMKKLLIILFTLISFNTFAVEKKTTFTQDLFNEAQKNGKIVKIYRRRKMFFSFLIIFQTCLIFSGKIPFGL